ncbi:MAG: hypothetical protein RLZZ465_813 [Bacteroidota bacterium]
MQMKKSLFAKNASLGIVAGLLLMLTTQSHRPEEGMFPLNYVNINDLKNAGLKLEGKDIFNPEGLSLTNALVKVGGCTGSFISKEGLIITNHHCVYGAVADASTVENNHLENGFVARTKEQEIPINMPCKITESYEDVSDRVLRGIDESYTPSQRAASISKNISNIVAEERVKHPEMSIEVSEMFVGKTYTLFRYVFLKDVRLVLAPPVTIGQFGGDSDNWEWPRHNGDFSLVRAYVGKDGKPAAYSKDNVPYQPAKTLKINPKGTQEGDFVFIMGYPGRTFRNETAPYLAFQEQVHLPKIQGFYSWYLGQIKDITKTNEAERLAFAGEVQSLENVEKNYRGKIQGLRRTQLVDARTTEENQMIEWAKTQKRYQQTGIAAMDTLRNQWAIKTATKDVRYWSQFVMNQSKYSYAIAAIENAKMQWVSVLATQNSNLQNTKTGEIKKAILTTLSKQLSGIEAPLNKDLEERMLIKMAIEGIELIKHTDAIAQAYRKGNLFGENQSYFNSRIKVMLKGQTAESWAKTAANTTRVNQLASLQSIAEAAKTAANSITEENQGNFTAKWWDKTICKEDALSQWGRLINRITIPVGAQSAKIEENIKAAMPIYLDMRRDFKATQFIPDANSTLRLTYGYIRRYSPNDGEIHQPYTYLDGIFEKANTRPDYRLPSVVADNLRIKDIAPIFKDPKTGKVIVGMLYNLDTTGGNSGSPVLNERGELIGINFDRSFTATINDYAWNENYSRSIGCDIRYALFVMKYVSRADHILGEIGITEEMLQGK